MKNGIYENMAFEEYVELPYLNSSKILPLLRSSLHMESQHISTASTRIGSIVDSMLTGGFDKEYTVLPSTYNNGKEVKPFNLNAKKCKEIKQHKEASGKNVITDNDYQTAQQMANNIRNCRSFDYLRGQNQVVMIWDSDGVKCKAMLDCLGNTFITDLKTTKDASKTAFSKSILKFGYHIQAYMYTEAVEKLTTETLPFYYVCVENSPPYAVNSFALGDTSLMKGQEVFERGKQAWVEYQENGAKGYKNEFEEINIPDWVLSKHNKGGLE